MLGRRLSQTHESAGWQYDPGIERVGGMFMVTGEPRRYKQYRGQASNEFQCDFFGRPDRCAEGASSGDLECTGTVRDTVEEFRGGVSSAVSYLGLTSMADLSPSTVQFIKISPATYREGTAHGV
jgi:hypothetical protein